MGWEQDGLGLGGILPRVSARPPNGWRRYQHGKSGIFHMTINDTIVVRTCRLLTAKSQGTRGAEEQTTNSEQPIKNTH